jgi:hypothetical protein
MKRSERDDNFYAAVSEEARLPVSDARDLVCEFFSAISGFVGHEAWGVLADLAPQDVKLGRTSHVEGGGTLEQFLTKMSGVESVETGRAAEHARVVAEALRSRADPSQLEMLQALIEDDELLALFELSRGELTEANTYSRQD